MNNPDQKTNFFLSFDPYETGANPTESNHNLTPGRFWHAEAESDIKTLRIRHPDLEMEENHLQKTYFWIRSRGYASETLQNYLEVQLITPPVIKVRAPMMFGGSEGEIYTVLDKESESEVENFEIPHSDLEIKENPEKRRKSLFPIISPICSFFLGGV